MKRWAYFAYGVGAHLCFLLTYGAFLGFIAGVAMPWSLDRPATTSWGWGVVVDSLLLALFAVQHSVMARPAFKRLWIRIVPEPLERSTYVWLSCLVTWLIIVGWQPIDTIVWQVRPPAARAGLHALFVAGCLLVPAVTFMLDHFDLFGTRQVWLFLRGREYQPLPFRVPLLYRHLRHPLYLGWAIVFWATPTMTGGRLLFAAVLTGYMALATLVEERDLLTQFGKEYAEYRRRVPRFWPSGWSLGAGDPHRRTGERSPAGKPVAEQAAP